MENIGGGKERKGSMFMKIKRILTVVLILSFLLCGLLLMSCGSKCPNNSYCRGDWVGSEFQVSSSCNSSSCNVNSKDQSQTCTSCN